MHVAAPCFSVLLVASALRELEFTFPLIMNKFSRPISIYGLVCFTPSRLPNSRSTLIYNTRLKKHDAVAGSYGNPYFLRVRRAMLRIELLCAGWRGCGVGLVRAPGACPSPMNTGFRTCVCVQHAVSNCLRGTVCHSYDAPPTPRLGERVPWHDAASWRFSRSGGACYTNSWHGGGASWPTDRSLWQAPWRKLPSARCSPGTPARM